VKQSKIRLTRSIFIGGISSIILPAIGSEQIISFVFVVKPQADDSAVTGGAGNTQENRGFYSDFFSTCYL
jgi:hypothetical protein